MLQQDLYCLFGLEKSASPDEIKKAYRKLALKHHPDKNSNLSNEAKLINDELMKEITNAYAILSDPEKRAYYDQYGATEAAAQTHSAEQSDLVQGKLTKLNDLITSFKNKYENNKTQLFSNAQTFDFFVTSIQSLHADLADTFKKRKTRLDRLFEFIFHNSADFFLLEDLAELLQHMMNDVNVNPSRCKQLIVQFGLSFREQSDEERCLGFFWGTHRDVETLLNGCTGLSLNELELSELDEEIQRIQNLQITHEKISDRDNFVTSLRALRKTISTNIREQDKGEVWAWESEDKRRFPSKAAVAKSEAVITLKKTTALLKKLSFDPENEEKEYNDFVAYGTEYEKSCKDNPRFTNFLKGVGTVIFSGMGLVVGIPAGALVGVLAGVFNGVFQTVLTVPYFTFKGAELGPKIGRDVGKKIFNISCSDSIARHLFFQSPYVVAAANNVAMSGMKFANPSQKAPEKIEDDKMKLITSPTFS